MHFSTLTVLGLATTSLASVLPRSQYGSWSVSVSKSAYANGFQSQTVSANFTSTSYPSGIISTCKYENNPTKTPAESSSCDNEAFEYTYDGQTIKLQQTVELPTPQTVFGSAPLTLKATGVGRTYTGEAVVDVTEAIA
ncbi:Nn.00g070080.m01.CDS01 [Neocucurbitaria sp. VM-36]